MKKTRHFLICLAVLLAGSFLCACGQEKPPENNTPEPPALNGTFVCEQGSMTFDGDGKSIRFEFTDDFAEAAGLPAAKGEGEYAFLFQHGLYRYDLAETFEIYVGEARVSFLNGHHETNENAIHLLPPTGGEDRLVFEKQP